MNWLAHLRLAPAEPLLRIGNLAGDFVRGIDLAVLHPQIRQGIEQHRAIDRFVDAHSAPRASRARFAAPWRRFAPVALDVFYDHFLARDWAQLGDGRSLHDFVDRVLEELFAHRELLPPELRRLLPRLVEQRWLSMYATVAGVERALRAMARRGRRSSPLATVAAELRRQYPAFEADFRTLWPELRRFAATLCMDTGHRDTRQ